MTRARLLVPLLATSLLAGCTVSLTVSGSAYTRPTSWETTDRPPPPLREDEEPGERPDPAAIWVGGHWLWQGGDWVWQPGSWKKPNPGYVWEPPVVAAVEGRYRYYPGYFRPRDEAPPPVYRQPDQIQVHVPAAIDANRDLPTRVVVSPAQPAPRDTLDPSQLERPEASIGEDDPEAPTPRLEEAGEGEAGGESEGGEGEGEGGELTNPNPDATQPDPQTVALSCSLTVARVPRSAGNFTVAGHGFTEDVVVTVGGSTAEIRLRTASQIQARTTRGGTVKVTRGDDVAECGSLELF
ncbi:MAG TPA: YXWGXW repeat-containing protein [Polyangiaceae bacterium LLY-WYZ-15_(1-7)]|nr:hypothetical protein [Myxococcales bacterium]MAT26017.1 hypothetical protein [Sandaracinus sp.]HJK92601.1 YXWGXW repeat-containing protein [Polyangiaceae bacterium LLY-WYZ-15_(1-7)]MBJ75052.1 hypothetical protein [Sandaracinus sp.]HJL03194.1 YXWGXW repeat-containing protein [Polyangiaceae bacterium LLY-WYZ-15_(1-7)]